MAMQHLWHKFITCFHKNHTNSNTIVSFKILELSKKKKENRKNLEISHLSSVSFSTTSYQNLSLSLSLSCSRNRKTSTFLSKVTLVYFTIRFPIEIVAVCHRAATTKCTYSEIVSNDGRVSTIGDQIIGGLFFSSVRVECPTVVNGSIFARD